MSAVDFGGVAHARRLPRELMARALDARAVAIRRALEAIAEPLARNARALVTRAAWTSAGYRNAHDFARERYGRSGRWLHDLARLGAVFDESPLLLQAFRGADGGPPTGIVATLLLARLPRSELDREWIAHARRVTVRELRRDIRRALAGERVLGEVARDEACDETGDDTCADVRDDDTEWAAPLRVAIALPAPVRAAFEEALDMFRGLCGAGATVTSFVEALVGESLASGGAESGPDPPGHGVWVGIARERIRSAFREELLRRASHDWAGLEAPRGAEAQDALAIRAAAATLEEWRSLVRRAGEGDAAELDETMRGLLEWERVARLRLGQVLARLSFDSLWSTLQFAGARHYGEQRLGMPERSIGDLLRLGRALPEWEVLDASFRSGDVTAEKALLLLRLFARVRSEDVAVGAWVRHAAECTVKRLRDEVQGYLRFDLDGIGIRECTPLSASGWSATLHRAAGTSTARVARAGLAAVERPAADVFLVLTLPVDLAESLAGEIERWRAALQSRFAGVLERPPGTPAMQAAWSCSRGGTRRIPAWIGLLALLEIFVAAHDVKGPRRPGADARALERAGYRCQAPGCTSRVVEAHHVLPRSRGGDDHEDNLVALCPFHHRAGVHGVLAEVTRVQDDDMLWRIGSGLLEATFRNEIRVAS